MKNKVFKFEGKTFPSKQALYQHINDTKMAELDKLNWEASRYYFFYKYGKTEGKSVISGKPTPWNPVTERYERFLPEEKAEYVTMFQERMKKKYGITHLTTDPQHQKRMLDNRRITTEYTWLDGSKTKCTSQYELDFLKFLEFTYNFKSEYLMEAPIIYYADEESKKFYIPDFFIPSLNLIVEVKGSNPHYQKRDSYKEVLKQKATESAGFSFIQVNDKMYLAFNVYFKENVLENVA